MKRRLRTRSNTAVYAGRGPLLVPHFDLVGVGRLFDALDHLLDHHVPNPVHELKNLPLGVLQADLAAVDTPPELLDEALSLLYDFLRLHGLPAS